MTYTPPLHLRYCRACEYYLPCMTRHGAPHVGACLRQYVVRDFEAAACVLYEQRRNP